MILWQTFIESLQLPRKQALFQLNRKGMDTVVFYLFILIMIASIPEFFNRIEANSTSDLQMNVFFLFIYFFIFYYLPLTVFVFAMLAIIAYIGVFIAKLMKRKLRFSLLWKMSAFTITIPFLIFTILALFFPIPNSYLFLTILYTLIMLIKMISIYPKRKEKTTQTSIK